MTRSPRPSKFLSRRRVLQALAAGTTGSLAGCSFFDGNQTPTEQPKTPAAVGRTPARGRKKREVPTGLQRRYDTARNVVQVGVDHTGTEPISDALESAAGDQTALFLPRGEYRMERPLELSSFKNLALVGDRALVRPAQGYADTLFDLGAESDAAGLRFEGIDFDLTAPKTGARPISAAVRDGLLVRDVTVHGRQDVNQDSMRFDVTGASGSGRVEGLKLPDGGATAYRNTGIYVGEQSVGTLTFADCYVDGFPDNGLYASPARGRVDVVGGAYRNNGIASVRVSGPSRIENVRVKCDTTRSGLENMRGIRLREGRNIVVADSRIEMRRVTESDAAITMAEWLDSAEVRNTHIETVADNVPAIRAKRPSRTRRRATSGPILVTDVRITGKAANEEAVMVDSRNDCRFERVCIRQSGPERDGIVLRNSRGTILTETTIDVTGDPLVLDNAKTKRQRIRTGGFGLNCRFG